MTPATAKKELTESTEFLPLEVDPPRLSYGNFKATVSRITKMKDVELIGFLQATEIARETVTKNARQSVGLATLQPRLGRLGQGLAMLRREAWRRMEKDPQKHKALKVIFGSQDSPRHGLQLWSFPPEDDRLDLIAN